jgi:hypothetical protein
VLTRLSFLSLFLVSFIWTTTALSRVGIVRRRKHGGESSGDAASYSAGIGGGCGRGDAAFWSASVGGGGASRDRKSANGGSATLQPARAVMGRVSARVLLRPTGKRSSIREHGWHVCLRQAE